MKAKDLKTKNSNPLLTEEENLLKEFKNAYKDLESNRRDLRFRKIKHIIEQKLLLSKLNNKNTNVINTQGVSH